MRRIISFCRHHIWSLVLFFGVVLLLFLASKFSLFHTDATDPLAEYTREVEDSAKTFVLQFPVQVDSATLAEAIERFLIDQQCVSLGEMTMQRVGGDEAAGGLSGNELFLVTTEDKKLFVKIFHSPSSFYQEFKTLKLFESLPTKLIHVPHIFTAGQCLVDNTPHFLIVEEYLQGKSLYDLLLSLLTEQNRDERERNLATLSNAYYLLGKGMSELHHVSMSRPVAMHPRIEQMILSKVAHGTDMLAKQASLPKERLMHLFDTMHATQKAKPVVHSFMHNDPHPGNFIYTNDGGGVYMLDLQDGAISIFEEKTPIGLPLRDYALLIDQIELCQKMGGLNVQECELIKGAFNRGYQEMGGCLPTSEEFLYYQWINVMGFIEWYLTNKTRFTVATTLILDRVYEQRVKWIKQLLKSS